MLIFFIHYSYTKGVTCEAEIAYTSVVPEFIPGFSGGSCCLTIVQWNLLPAAAVHCPTLQRILQQHI